MSQELFYTSAAAGLDLGSSGFCTVAATRGLSKRLREKLQAVSGYRHLFAPLDARNPVSFSHLRLSDRGVTYHVLSRVADAPLDYTGRGNSFAHHVVLEAAELPRGGPAWLLAQPGFLETGWQGSPRWLSDGRPVPQGDVRAGPCRFWEAVAGDAGWAGLLAQAFESDPGKPVALFVHPDTPALALVSEALALLAPEQRWEVTFNTFFWGVQPGTACAWRFLPGAAAAADGQVWLGGALVLDLTAPLGRAPEGPLVDAARSGRVPVRPTRPQPVAAAAVPRPREANEAARRPENPRPAEPVLPRRSWSDSVVKAAAPPAVGQSRPDPAAVIAAPAATVRTGREGGWMWGVGLGLGLGMLVALGLALTFWFTGGPRDKLDRLGKEKDALTEEKRRLLDDKAALIQTRDTLGGKVRDLETLRIQLEEEVKRRDDSAKTQKGLTAQERDRNQHLADEKIRLAKDLDSERLNARKVAAKKAALEALFKVFRETLARDSSLGRELDQILENADPADAQRIRQSLGKWYEVKVKLEIEAEAAFQACKFPLGEVYLWNETVKHLMDRRVSLENAEATYERLLDACNDIVKNKAGTLAAEKASRKKVWLKSWDMAKENRKLMAWVQKQRQRLKIP